MAETTARTWTQEEVRELAAKIGIGSLSHLSEGRESNAAVLKDAHDALRAFAALLAERDRPETLRIRRQAVLETIDSLERGGWLKPKDAKHIRATLPALDQPTPDAVCAHGTAMDVHCCNCHSGFIFEIDHECPEPTAERDRPTPTAEAAEAIQRLLSRLGKIFHHLREAERGSPSTPT